MATATDLPEAAGQAFSNLYTKWLLGDNTLKGNLSAFVDALLPVFQEQDVTTHPISNWLVLIDAVAEVMTTGTAPPPYEQLVTAADYVYRVCWVAAEPTASSPRTTTAQRAAILAAYNANF